MPEATGELLHLARGAGGRARRPLPRIQALGRSAANVLKVYDLALSFIVLQPRKAAERLASEMTEPTVYRSVAALETLGILGELTGRGRSRVYGYREYLEILSAGVTPTAES